MKKRSWEILIIAGALLIVILTGIGFFEGGNSPKGGINPGDRPDNLTLEGETKTDKPSTTYEYEPVGTVEGFISSPVELEDAPVFDRTIPVWMNEEGEIQELEIPEWDYHPNFLAQRISRKYDVVISPERVKKWNKWYQDRIFAIDPNSYFSVGDMLLYEQSDFRRYFAFCVRSISLVSEFSTKNGVLLNAAAQDFLGADTVSSGHFYYESDTEKSLFPYSFLDIEITLFNRLNESQLCAYRYPRLIFEEAYEGELIVGGFDNMILQGKEGRYSMNAPIYLDAPEMNSNNFYCMSAKEEKTYHVYFLVDPNHIDTMVLSISPSAMAYSYSEANFLIRVADFLK